MKKEITFIGTKENQVHRRLAKEQQAKPESNFGVALGVALREAKDREMGVLAC